MTDERIESVLADFRGWLKALPQEPPAAVPVEAFDVGALVAQFTALRHDVNVQTKAARAAVEQSNGVLQQLQSQKVEPEETEPEHLKPFVKMILDVHDALSIAHRQMEKAIFLADDLADEFAPPTFGTTSPGFFARLFGAVPFDAVAWQAYRKKLDDSNAKLRDQFAGAADGYAMSLRRVERAFPDLGLERIRCLDEPFDPEMMEVVDTVTAGDREPGTVVEVLRHGYIRNESLFRYAQVKVAK